MYKTRDKEIACKSYFIHYYNKYKYVQIRLTIKYNDAMKLNVLTYISG